jgi:hypothetical protein
MFLPLSWDPQTIKEFGNYRPIRFITCFPLQSLQRSPRQETEDVLALKRFILIFSFHANRTPDRVGSNLLRIQRYRAHISNRRIAVKAAFIRGLPEYLQSNQATTASTIFLFIIH